MLVSNSPMRERPAMRSSGRPGSTSANTRRALAVSAATSASRAGSSRSASLRKVMAGEVILRRTMGHSSTRRNPSMRMDSARSGEAPAGSQSTTLASKR